MAGLWFLQRSLSQRENTEATLQHSVLALEESSREIDILGRTGTLLQSAVEYAEAFSILEGAAKDLFRSRSGALCILNSSKNLLEVVARFGAPLLGDDPTFSPEECWALRSGRVQATPEDGKPLCSHFGTRERGGSLCVPMAAQHETIGVFCLGGAKLSGPLTGLANAFAEQAALAFANLRLRDSLRNQANRDPLTSLYNRRYLEESFERELRRATRRNMSVGVMMLDLDEFKKFNDRNGHQAGDAALKAVAAVIGASCRAEDIACRYGGEEFALILPDASLQNTILKAQAIVQAVREAVVLQGIVELPRVTISIGVAAFPDHGESAAAILGAADRALYRAKERGRDGVVSAERITEAPRIAQA